MKSVSLALIILVALLHLGFLILEMFLWQQDIGLKTFGNTPQQAADSAILAMNQGLYNGFLAAGLIWSVGKNKADVQVFFLVCVVVAGVFGAVTAKPSIFVVQALPAILALVFLKLSR